MLHCEAGEELVLQGEAALKQTAIETSSSNKKMQKKMIFQDIVS